ncbi:hypothetical protein GCK72_010452 [Caenorhabditis remanei]|uniref:Uncharacterized protein n=1 Tax=Caenorhabditis remanei TaxID=31234 RepID=A0A6A5H2X6_CAERE|nr:hypothetical protein GCK72_010452 [Caenorhabditis remanei]KAF1762190.1 hypothetical protein GCK72_010452 [Caenorhabditis remanei]
MNKPLAESVLGLDLVMAFDGENVSLEIDLQLLWLESSDIELDGKLVVGVLDFVVLLWNDVVEVVEHAHALSPVWHHWLEVTKKSHWATGIWADRHS